MKEFGKRYYKHTFYYNFDEENNLNSIFETNKDPNRIIELLSIISGEKIDADNSLIIFDEIQECSEALNSLKYFNEKAHEYHIITAGSLLGTLLAAPKAYPVGKVNLMDISPLSFGEFLLACDENLYKYYVSVEKEQRIEDIFHVKLLDVYHNYLIIGGMPECVASWCNYKDPKRIAEIQHELLEVYENDFSKHNGKINSGRLLMVFRSIASQLAKENEKFVYGALRKGGRAREFEEAIEWLVSAGLLKNMAGIDNAAILLKSDYQFKGPLTENYVLQQIKNQFDVAPRYYSNRYGEIDFIIQYGTDVIPVEAKGGIDKSAPTFKTYIKEHDASLAIRISERGYRRDGAITNFPPYLAGRIIDLI